MQLYFSIHTLKARRFGTVLEMIVKRQSFIFQMVLLLSVVVVVAQGAATFLGSLSNDDDEGNKNVKICIFVNEKQ